MFVQWLVVLVLISCPGPLPQAFAWVENKVISQVNLKQCVFSGGGMVSVLWKRSCQRSEHGTTEPARGQKNLVHSTPIPWQSS